MTRYYLQCLADHILYPSHSSRISLRLDTGINGLHYPWKIPALHSRKLGKGAHHSHLNYLSGDRYNTQSKNVGICSLSCKKQIRILMLLLIRLMLEPRERQFMLAQRDSQETARSPLLREKHNIFFIFFCSKQTDPNWKSFPLANGTILLSAAKLMFYCSCYFSFFFVFSLSGPPEWIICLDLTLIFTLSNPVRFKLSVQAKP